MPKKSKLQVHLEGEIERLENHAAHCDEIADEHHARAEEARIQAELLQAAIDAVNGPNDDEQDA